MPQGVASKPFMPFPYMSCRTQTRLTPNSFGFVVVGSALMLRGGGGKGCWVVDSVC